MAITPVVSVNKTANTITVRGTPNIVNILEKVIQANDRPRAEVVVDVELLEVNRQRAKELGLNLSQYQIGAIFSPEGAAGRRRRPTPARRRGRERSGHRRHAPFNLNTISQGISTADFYLTVPQAIVKFLASDTPHARCSPSRSCAARKARDLELNLGDEIPVPSTVFGGLGGRRRQHGADLSRSPIGTVGVIVKMKPRVTFENEIILEIEVENSTLGGNINVAGQSLPTFGTRKVKTRMRLREGESNLLAGLVREEDRTRADAAFPGLMRIPILKDILGGTEEQISQTDIVILLTPRIVRTHELTQEHLNPIYIGSQMNLGLTGPTPVIGAEPLPAAPEPARGHAAWHRAAGRAAGEHVADAGRRHSTPGLAPPAPATPPPPPPQPNRRRSRSRRRRHLADAGSAPTPVRRPAAPGRRRRRRRRRQRTARGGRCRRAGAHAPGQRHDAGAGVPRRRRAVHGADRRQQRLAPVAHERLAHLQPGAGPRALACRKARSSGRAASTPSFNQQVDANAGRVDISVTRGGDATGASGTGLLAALVFDAMAPGTATFTVSGVARQPDGPPVPVTFIPATVTVR